MTSSADGAACAKSIGESAVPISINLTAALTTSIGSCIFIDLSLPWLRWAWSIRFYRSLESAERQLVHNAIQLHWHDQPKRLEDIVKTI
jgi:hypothetical protein